MFSSPWDSILQGSNVRSTDGLATVKLNDSLGALRSTKNSGLQPAMDFILEHNEDPIPDATSSAQPQSEPINVDDEDEDDAAALGFQSGDSSQADSGAVGVEARVRSNIFFDRNWII